MRHQERHSGLSLRRCCCRMEVGVPILQGRGINSARLRTGDVREVSASSTAVETMIVSPGNNTESQTGQHLLGVRHDPGSAPSS